MYGIEACSKLQVSATFYILRYLCYYTFEYTILSKL